MSQLIQMLEKPSRPGAKAPAEVLSRAPTKGLTQPPPRAPMRPSDPTLPIKASAMAKERVAKPTPRGVVFIDHSNPGARRRLLPIAPGGNLKTWLVLAVAVAALVAALYVFGIPSALWRSL